MCGIVGLWQLNSNSLDIRSSLIKMSSALEHRGPNSNGLWIDDTASIGFGHRRLAIQDLSPLGHQPMLSKSGRYVITYNGEIYNFKEIGKKLLENGHKFVGHSDTEVLLASIEQWGFRETLKLCRGMFALALWDKQTKTLSLARDRMGEKPLYFGIIKNTFVFCSELKSVYSAFPARELTLDQAALSSYFEFGYISAPSTCFTELRKLEPGKILQIPLKENTFDIEAVCSQQKAYWKLEAIASEQSKQTIHDSRTATDNLDTILNLAIQEQSIADVPLGSFLSGGIDSSIVSAILQANQKKPIKTFTIGFDDKFFNEAEHAKQVARHLSTDHHEAYVSAHDLLNYIDDIITTFDEPFADSSQLPMLIVSKLAQREVTVCLSGDGGDELFAGYNRHTQTKPFFDKVSSLPLSIRRNLSKFLLSIPPRFWDKTYQSFKKVTNDSTGAAFGLKVHKFAKLLASNSLHEAYIDLQKYWPSNENSIVTRSSKVPDLEFNVQELTFLSSALGWDQKWYLPGDNLVKTDRASMSASLEMRLPILDQRVVEYSWRLSDELKVHNGKSKWLLRQVLYRYVPAKLIDRPKMGFSVPLAKWLKSDLKAWGDNLLSTSSLKRHGLLDASLIRRTWSEHQSGKFDHSHKLWTVLIFQAWYDKFIVKDHHE